jgi:hypothetical protein
VRHLLEAPRHLGDARAEPIRDRRSEPENTSPDSLTSLCLTSCLLFSLLSRLLFPSLLDVPVVLYACSCRLRLWTVRAGTVTGPGRHECRMAWHAPAAVAARGARHAVHPTGRPGHSPPGWQGRQRPCPACDRTILLRRDGLVISHKTSSLRGPGSVQRPAEPVPVASWLPLCPGLTPHGLRHGHQTWLDDLGVRYILQSERMGHEVPGMRGVYSHVTPGMRADLVAGLQELWGGFSPGTSPHGDASLVGALDTLLASWQ